MKVKTFVVLLIISLFYNCAKEVEDPLFKGFNKVNMENIGWVESDLPILMKASTDIDTTTILRMEEEMDKWEDSSQMDFFYQLEPTEQKDFSDLKDYYIKDNETNGIYFSHAPFKDMEQTYLAVTQIFIKPNESGENGFSYQIIHADIIINTQTHPFSNDELDSHSYYLPRVILHELGHVLGLKHEDEGVMEASLSLWDRDIELTDFEIELIKKKYNSNTSSSMIMIDREQNGVIRLVTYIKEL